MSEGIRTTKEVMSTKRAQALAAQDNTTVLEYTYDAAEGTMSAVQQHELFDKIIRAFDTGCAAYPTLSDEALRERVLSNPDARAFQRLYNKVFAVATVRAHGDADVARLDKIRKGMYVIFAERRFGTGTEDERAARAMHTGMRLAMRPMMPGEDKGSICLDSTAREAGVDPSTMKPLDPREFGPCTVHQT